ncbi:MAG: hypothetical protein ACKOX6_12850 [Bdellovibrio sp.]
MRAILFGFISLVTLPTMALTVSKLNCTTIRGDVVNINFAHAFDPQSPWIGRFSFEGKLEVYPKWSRQTYETEMTLSPVSGRTDDINIRGDGHQEWVYLQLYPQTVRGSANGQYTGQLFINDLAKRAYLDYRSEGDQPGLKCK